MLEVSTDKASLIDYYNDQIVALKNKIDFYSYAKYTMNLLVTLCMFSLFFISPVYMQFALIIAMVFSVGLFAIECFIHSVTNKRTDYIVKMENLII